MSLHVLAQADKSRVLLMPLREGKVLFEGYLRIKDTPKGPRPYKFLVRKDGEQYLPPEEAIRMLRLAGGIFLVPGDPVQEDRFLGLLQGYQLKHRKIQVCPHCLARKEVRLIDGRSVSYKGGRICMDCAMTELAQEAEFRHLGRLARSHLQRLLRRRGNLDDVLSLLNLNRLDPELTRFDVIPASQGSISMEVVDLDIPAPFKEVLRQRLQDLLPVQALAVEGGLLQSRSQLVVSATATGKSLVGEMAGIKNLLEGRGKLLFLVPLVALANQKFDHLRTYGQLGLSTSIKVGVSRIKMGSLKSLPGSLKADMVVGTYEGLDQAIRTGKDLGEVGTVVIDEVHMLEDKERGHRLAGLIARLKHKAPEAQFIYLSATVGNPEGLARQLQGDLIQYEIRPIPIERHLIFIGPGERLGLMRELVREGAATRSSTGYKGQTIIFTNSRKNCNSLAQAIPGAAAYHAGLQYHERKKIEEAFSRGELDAVVTTAALAAGVDFPASTVVFESLAMGIEWLTVHEFNQMLGRAGRPGYHDKGLVYILAEPGRRFSGSSGDAEDEVALRLLSGIMEDVAPAYEEEQQLEEVLANAVVARSREELERLHSLTLGLDDLDRALAELARKGLIRGLRPTPLGRVASAHFLSPTQVETVTRELGKGSSPLEAVVALEHFRDLYLKAADRISVALRMQISSRVLHGSFLDLINSPDLRELDKKIQDQCMNFARDFMRCTCSDAPYCGCVERGVSLRILDSRSRGSSPEEILRQFSDLYGFYAYQGDLINYLDQVVRYLEGVEALAGVLGMEETAREAAGIRKRIEG